MVPEAIERGGGGGMFSLELMELYSSGAQRSVSLLVIYAS